VGVETPDLGPSPTYSRGDGLTKYKILMLTDEGWVVIGERETHGPQTAMRKATDDIATEDLEAGVTLAAVPVTNWTEERVKLETPEPRLVVGAQTTIEEVAVEPEEEPEPEAEEEAQTA
jgi:hypothetical protein